MRATKSSTSCSAKALSSDSIGTAWRTFLKSPRRRRADLLRRRVGADEFRKAGLDGVEALAQRVVFGVGNAGRVVLIVALVVALQLKRQPFQLDLGLRLGELGDVGENVFFGFAVMIKLRPSFRDGPQDQPQFESGSRRLSESLARPVARPGMTSRRRRLQQPLGGGPRFGGDLGAGQHAGDFLAAVIGGERVDAGGDALALVERVL